MFTLYARSGSGSAAVEAVLAECGGEFDRIEIPRLGQDFETYLKLNPTGKVPMLRLADHSLMTESAAMVIYLADLHPKSGLAPSLNSPLRAPYLRWILYFATDVYMANLRFYYSGRHSVDVDAAEGIKAQSVIDMSGQLSILSNALGKGPYILGEVFSAADIYAAMLVGWFPDLKVLFAKYPNIETHYGLVSARPKILPVWQRNEMPLL